MQSDKQLQVSSDAALELASINKPMSRAVNLARHHLKFREYNQEMLTETQKRLLAIAYHLGITVPPKPPELAAIAAFLKDHFGESNMEEVSYAAELFMLERLETKAQPYNQLTKIFVGKMMLAYQQFRLAEVRRVEAIERRIRETEEENMRRAALPPTAEAIHAAWLKKEEESWTWLLTHPDSPISRGEIPLAWRWEETYEYLNQSGQVTETIQELTVKKEGWKKLFEVEVQKDKTSVQRLRSGSELKNAIDEFNRKLKDPGELKDFCRKMYVIEKLKSILNENKK